MASSTPTPAGRHPFLQKIEDTKISKSDVNNLIMDYLIAEGYPLAAGKFALEANLQHKFDLETINERVQIRDSIHKGDLQTAIESINEVNHDLLDEDHALHFSLLRLQLIELIKQIPTAKDRQAATVEALQFSSNLAPYASTNDSFRHDLEAAMSLLIFKPEQWAKQQQIHVSPGATSPAFGVLSDLVDPSLRKKVAKDVNEAILQSQGQKREARIRQLVRTRAWAEKMARDKLMDLPEKMDLGLDLEQDNRVMSHVSPTPNGHSNGVNIGGGDTIMTESGISTAAIADNGGGTGTAMAEGDAALAQYTNL